MTKVFFMFSSSLANIGSALKSSHDDYKSVRIRPSLPDTQHHICPICRLQCEVDIKDMRSKLKKEDLLPKQLYTDVNKCSDGRGHQDILWKRLFKHFISLKQERVETTFVDFLKPNHKGLYDYFIQKYPTHFECSCQKWICSLVCKSIGFVVHSLLAVFGMIIEQVFKGLLFHCIPYFEIL